MNIVKCFRSGISLVNHSPVGRHLFPSSLSHLTHRTISCVSKNILHSVPLADRRAPYSQNRWFSSLSSAELARQQLQADPKKLAETLGSYQLDDYQEQLIIKELIKIEPKLVAQHLSTYSVFTGSRQYLNTGSRQYLNEVLLLLIEKDSSVVCDYINSYKIINPYVLSVLARKEPAFVAKHLNSYPLDSSGQAQIVYILLKAADADPVLKEYLLSKNIFRSIYLADHRAPYSQNRWFSSLSSAELARQQLQADPKKLAETLGSYQLDDYQEQLIIKELIKIEPKLVAQHLSTYSVFAGESLYLGEVLLLLIEKDSSAVCNYIDLGELKNFFFMPEVVKALAEKEPEYVAIHLGRYDLGRSHDLNEREILFILIDKTPKLVAQHLSTYFKNSQMYIGGVLIRLIEKDSSVVCDHISSYKIINPSTLHFVLSVLAKKEPAFVAKHLDSYTQVNSKFGR